MPCLPFCLGCAGEGRALRGLLQPVEGLYTILCPPGPPHCPHFHLLGADEQGLQASLPQWLRRVGGLESLRWGSISPPAPTVSVPQPWGPGLCYPGPLYLFSQHGVVPCSTVKDFGLSCPAPACPPCPDQHHLCPWLYLGSSLGISGASLDISFRAHRTAEAPPFSVGKPRQG